jgi:hypothetical protein
VHLEANGQKILESWFHGDEIERDMFSAQGAIPLLHICLAARRQLEIVGGRQTAHFDEWMDA